MSFFIMRIWICFINFVYHKNTTMNRKGETLLKIQSKDELNANLIKVEEYLNFAEGQEMRDEMIKLIERGKNFVAYKVNEQMHFAPSRFVGYANNNIAVHLESREKHGSTTSNNLRSAKLLGVDSVDDVLCELYIKFCKSLNSKSKVSRFPNKPQTFWRYECEKIDAEIEDYGGFPEGKEYEITHFRKERNSKLIKIAKKNFIEKSNGCQCQVCGFDFGEVYGELGENYIEAHHTLPISDLKKETITVIEDIVFVCSNCHSMLHRRRPWLTILDLKNILVSI